MKKGNKVFDAVFTQLQKIDGYAVLFDTFGSPSIIMQVINPVQMLCTDSEPYVRYHEILSNLVQVLGEGYAIQKQDIFCKQVYKKNVGDDTEFLSKCYFNYFEGREYTEIKTYFIITQQPQNGRYVQFDQRKWNEFITRVEKFRDVLKEKQISYEFLNVEQINEYVHRFMAMDFRNGAFSMSNFKASDEHLRIGDRAVKSISLVDIDEFNMPASVSPFVTSKVNGYSVASDLFGFFIDIPDVSCVVYNQVIQIPNQRKLLSKLQLKAKRHRSMPDAVNHVAAQDIQNVLDVVSVDSKWLVNCNFNIIVSCPIDKLSSTSSFVETKLFDSGIVPSGNAYNQLELFVNSFPGNAYRFNPEYDLFLTLADAALCMFYKEHLKVSENTPLKTYYTDRRGIPVCIDITGKEGATKYTDNANFFCIGPSGSGKSFHMNSVVRQLLEQGTDVVMVDTGDSYEGICRYFNGTYITYSKEKPISMNPFKITELEYNENFGEKKVFLKNLIFLIFKGAQLPSKIEDSIINQVIVEYYQEYFNPFSGFTNLEREDLRHTLQLSRRMNSDFDSSLEDINEIRARIRREPEPYENRTALMKPSEVKVARLIYQCQCFNKVINDDAATVSEKEAALTKLNEFEQKLQDSSYEMVIEKQIDFLESQKRRLRVSELSFNSFFDFAMERIPQIMKQDEVDFDIRNFRKIMMTFYKGGELAHTLNSDLDLNLFDEKFIVFEIDKIKDDPVLFPIVVLIIMDVFLQKMRIKKGRKALIIEEAWKAIASPTMAEYIKYLYKTVRKFHGIAGVVTQELNDVIDSPIVKEAIINNSDIKILLDQTKFKDRYDDISNILGLTDVQRQQIFTINALQNKEGRNYFKEVWICRGLQSDVYGVEEPPECYWAYTTERAEKEALKIYIKHYGNIQDAIVNIELDRNQLRIRKYLDFANLVNKHQKIMQLWED